MDYSKPDESIYSSSTPTYSKPTVGKTVPAFLFSKSQAEINEILSASPDSLLKNKVNDANDARMNN